MTEGYPKNLWMLIDKVSFRAFLGLSTQDMQLRTGKHTKCLRQEP